MGFPLRVLWSLEGFEDRKRVIRTMCSKVSPAAVGRLGCSGEMGERLRGHWGCKSGDAGKRKGGLNPVKGSGRGGSISEMKGWPWDTSDCQGKEGGRWPQGSGSLGHNVHEGVHP